MITPKPCRVVVLDSFDISTIEGLSQEKTERAQQILSEHNPNDFMSFGVNWSEGLAGTDKRFMPYNGALSSAQIAWLERTLSSAAEEGERVVVLCHVPLHPRAADNLCLLWNYQVSSLSSPSVSVKFVLPARAVSTGEVWLCDGGAGRPRPRGRLPPGGRGAPPHPQLPPPVC